MSLWNKKIIPMLLDEKMKPFNDNNYLFEIKYDGMRTLIYATNNSIKLVSRNGINMTKLFPELYSIKSLVKNKVIFDGEIICNKDNYPSFSKLQERLHLKDNNKIKNKSNINPAIFMCFDIIYDNKDITNLSLLERKKILDKYNNTNNFIKIKYILENGKELFKLVKRNNIEGIVAKDVNSKYYINTRSSEWIKVKNYKKEMFYIGGYTYKESSNVFSVALGEYINNKLLFVGRVFISKKNKLFKLLLKEKIIKSKFINYFDISFNYINPKYTCFIKYINRTNSNHLREPFYIK